MMSLTRVRSSVSIACNIYGSRIPVVKRSFHTENSLSMVGSAVRGFWAHLTDESARKEFQHFVKKNVINQSLLAQNMGGRFLMMALLDQLRNPLFSKNSFDIGDFVENVAPALEVYHDILLRLAADTAKVSPDEASKAEKVNKDSESIKIDKVFDGDDDGDVVNEWRQEAIKDPHSLAAQFGKMTTEDHFDEQYRPARIIRLLSESGMQPSMEYIAESCNIEYVCLLNANVAEMDEELYQNSEHPEFAASDPKAQNLPVLAQFQVMYYLTRKFRPTTSLPSPTSASESYKALYNTATASGESPKTTEDPSESPKDEKSIDSLKNENNSVVEDNDASVLVDRRSGVAFFEGWLKGGPGNSLRWKIADTKEI